MKRGTLVVALEGVVAGTLTRSRQGLRFEYAETYRGDTSATPLSVSMPLHVRAHTTTTVEPWLRGLLPDNPEVLRRWARRFGASAVSTFELLATPIGEDCAGAVQFAPPDRIEHVLRRPGTISWLDSAEVAERLRLLRADGAAWLGPDFTGQWSLAGAQAKTALRYDNGRWGEPSGAAATTHILKPAIAGLDDHDLNEHLCLAAARRAGITVARSSIERFDDQQAVVIERYDRTWHDGELLRVHQEDLCQAMSLSPDNKYEADGGPTVAQIANLLRTVMPARVADVATRQFLDALSWNWIIAGTDAHAKNHSLLLSRDQIRFAPLYDIASALPYDGVYAPKLKLAMKLGGEYQLNAHSRRSWIRVADELALDTDLVIDRVREVAAVAAEAFSDVARTDKVIELASPLPSRLVDAVGERALECGRVLQR